MLATFYIFGFQALYIDDDLIDVIIMIRGCTLVAGQIQSNGLATVFQFPSLDNYIEAAHNDLDEYSSIEFELAMSALASFEVLKPLCTQEVKLLTLSLL
jgi:hypothetical protein